MIKQKVFANVKSYSFNLHTRYSPLDIFTEALSISAIYKIPMDLKKTVLRSDGVSFRYLMNETTAEMIIRILFQLPGVTKVELLKGRNRQILRNPFDSHDETGI
ncbi:MAG: hypothetical protein ABI675_14955 [Chitinophagaceae bacterium]